MLQAQTSRSLTSWLRGEATRHSRLSGIVHSMQQAVKKESEERLNLPQVLDWLLQDGVIAAEAAETLKKERRYYRGVLHPLVIVSDQKWKSALPPHRPLSLDSLMEWLAKRGGMGDVHIDPLKIDFSGGAEGMSSADATRFRILPVAVNSKEATIATAEPYIRDWERELAPIIKRDVRRVIANPVDIERYQVEFYNLAKSIKGAGKNAAGA